MTLGHALQPLAFMEGCAASADLALHMYFLEKVRRPRDSSAIGILGAAFKFPAVTH